MKYIVIDNSDFPIAFYDDEINETIPSEAFKINESDYVELTSNQGRRRWNGSEVVEYIPPFNPEACASQIKRLANKTILTIADENQQRNMLAVGLEISDKKTDGIPITEAETKMSEDILAVWALIKAVRAKSNELETIYVNKGEDLTTDDLITIENTLKQAGGLS